MPHFDFALAAGLILVVVFAITTRMHLTKYNIIVLTIGLAVIFVLSANYDALAHVRL